MRTEKKLQFEKSSHKSAEEIKAACCKWQAGDLLRYDIRSNGDHIWIEVEDRKKQYWSPMLHLRLVKSDNETRIKGTFAENPVLWAVFTMVKIASVFIFVLSGIVAWLKFSLSYNFNTQLFVMFGMVSVWFAIYLISERYKRRGAGQIDELYHFVESIAA